MIRVNSGEVGRLATGLEYLIDREQPVFTREATTESEVDRLLITDVGGMRFGSSDLIGTWGLDMIVPGEVEECSTGW